MTAYLVVRAVVSDDRDRPGFDIWYRREHLPDALKALKAVSAMRGWSTSDPSMHMAYYRFDTLAAVRAISDSPEMKVLIAEFDRVWDTRVQRTRDIMMVADELKG